jgi:phosphate transport system protein
MERHFDEQLQDLKSQLMKMSALAEVMIADAIKTVVEGEAGAASPVYEREELVNAMEIEIDEICLRLIALHQPTASDLRFIIGAVKANAELERLADESVNIARKSANLQDASRLKPFEILPGMAALARGMVRDSLRAFVNQNIALAREVIKRDDKLDDLRAEIAAALVRHVMQKPADDAPKAIDLLVISRCLERIGDHATNVSEITIFVVEGRDVRHRADERRLVNRPFAPADALAPAH